MEQLPPPPMAELRTTTRTWHVLAAHVLAEARWRRDGSIRLAPAPAGLRTGGDGTEEVRVERDELVVRTARGEQRARLTTVEDAQRLVLGTPGPTRWVEELDLHDPPPPVPPDTPLPIDAAAAAWLGVWFQLGWDTLQVLATDPASEAASEPTLWPEHLDVAIEVLPGDRRASYGVSPGDAGIAEPYAYVSVWYPDRLGGLHDPRWDATAFPGALVRARDLAGAPATALLDWFRQRRDLLTAA